MLVAPGTHAQDTGSTQVGKATISVGGGTAILDLPDVALINRTPTNNVGTTVIDSFATSEDFSDEVGWNANASLHMPLSGGHGVTINGFWAHIEDDDTTACTRVAGANCVINALVPNPAMPDFINPGAPGESFITTATRDVDQTGLSIEYSKMLTPGIMGVTRAPSARYLTVGLDWRGIDQGLNQVTRSTFFPTVNVQYREELDTNYHGIYAAYGGGITPFFFKKLWERMGLQSSFRLRAGVYKARSEYTGQLDSSLLPMAVNSQATDSHDEVAFIGGLTLETRKQIGRRAALSLKSEYEYYSYVPKMNYNDTINGFLSGPNVGTTIGDDDAYGIRTSLRLSVKLGPDEIMK